MPSDTDAGDVELEELFSFASRCRIEHYFPQIADAWNLPETEFLARLSECEALRDFARGEVDVMRELARQEERRLSGLMRR